MYARMLENFPSGPLDPRGEELRREMSTHVVPPKRTKGNSSRLWQDQISRGRHRAKKIPIPSARALKHLHDYRNETQHQDQVRSESIKPATLVYFDIAADFLVRLHPGTTVWHGGQNYDWLKKYGIQQKFVSQETHPRIAEGLRAGLPIDIAGIRTALATHLKDRINAMENQLVFVEECFAR